MIAPLDRLIIEASVLAGAPHPCQVLGHRWKHIGGMNCGCEGVDAEGTPWQGQCSVPVYKCVVCDDSDYGDNTEAVEKRRACQEAADG